MTRFDRYPAGVPCFVEAFSPDLESARRFYAGIFGWDFAGPGPMPTDPPGEYWVASVRGAEVAGLGSMPSPDTPVTWGTQVSVDDVDAAAQLARDAGGTVLVEPVDAPPAGRLAVLADPTGATITVWQAGARHGAALFNEPSAWAMSWLATPAPEPAAAFYEAVFGWRRESFEDAGPGVRCPPARTSGARRSSTSLVTWWRRWPPSPTPMPRPAGASTSGSPMPTPPPTRLRAWAAASSRHRTTRRRFAGPSSPRPTVRRSRSASCAGERPGPGRPGPERPVGSRPIATVVFFPEGAFGPTNNCVGIGAVLRARGHRVVFVIEESFAGTLAEQGFEERLMRLGPPPAEPEAPGQFWKDFVRDTAPVFRGTTTEQLDGFVIPTWQALLDGARYVDERLREIFAELDASVIVEDNVCAFPAIAASGRPWVRIVSCNPLEVDDPGLPPAFSGLPTGDRDAAAAFRAEYAARAGELQAAFSEYCVARGAPPLPELRMIHESPWLNLTLYPDELDYPRSRPLGPTWHNLQTSVRATDAPWDPPAGDGRRLVYLSLGSLGSADVELMRALVAALADTPQRYIVSRGPRHDEYELAENMIGAEFLPQTSVLPYVDAVITHGGNNTVTESMWFGKPMLVLPIFWDQPDNAQRVDEAGYGIRIPTYGFEPGALGAAVGRVLTDEALRGRVRAAGERLRRRPGTVVAADLIERVAAG